MLLKKSNWEFVTSEGIGASVGFISAGAGMYQIKDTTTGDIVQIDYAMAGPAAPTLTFKKIKQFFSLAKNMPTVAGSNPNFFSAGRIFETHRAPAGSPLRMFTDGFFEVINADLLAAHFGMSGSVFLWVPHHHKWFDLERFGIPITAFGLFTGLEGGGGIPGAGANASLGRVVSVSIVSTDD
ncbi:MAG: hypothetical protein ABI878_06045 [Acidobacteriota bacterium]